METAALPLSYTPIFRSQFTFNSPVTRLYLRSGTLHSPRAGSPPMLFTIAYPWLRQSIETSTTWRSVRDSNPSSPVDSGWPSLTATGPIWNLRAVTIRAISGPQPDVYPSTLRRHWRRERGSNPRTRICNPVPNHSAIPSNSGFPGPPTVNLLPTPRSCHTERTRRKLGWHGWTRTSLVLG